MVTAATLSIAVVPLATYLLGKYFNRPFAMGPAAVAKLILPTVLLPVAAGMLVRKFLPAIAHRIASPVAHIAGICLIAGGAVHTDLRGAYDMAAYRQRNDPGLHRLHRRWNCSGASAGRTRSRRKGYACTLHRVPPPCARGCHRGGELRRRTPRFCFGSTVRSA